MGTGTITLKNVRCSFLNAIEPRAAQAGQEPRYSVSLLIPKTDKEQLKLVQSTLVAVANEKWKAAAPGVLKKLQTEDKLCLHDGDQKLSADGEPLDGYAGHWYINAASGAQSPPKVFRGRDLVTPENVAKFRDGVPYSGCFVHALVTLWPQDNQYGRRVNASFDAVIFAADGPRFGGGGVSTQTALDAFAEFIQDDAAVLEGAAPKDEAQDDGLSLFA